MRVTTRSWVCVVASMSAMASVHEQVQQRTGQDDEVWKQTEGVGAVLREQEEGRDEQKANRGESCL